MIFISTRRVEIRPVEKYWLESFIMSVPLQFLINSFGSFLLLFNSSATDLKCFWPFNNKKLPSAKPAMVWTKLKFAKFQNIMTSAS